MEIIFSEQEIASMIDFALKNKGGPVLVGPRMGPPSISIERGVRPGEGTAETNNLLQYVTVNYPISLRVVYGPETASSPRPQTPPSGSSYEDRHGDEDEHECPNCGSTFIKNHPRQKYCKDEECVKARQLQANLKSRTKNESNKISENDSLVSRMFGEPGSLDDDLDEDEDDLDDDEEL